MIRQSGIYERTLAAMGRIPRYRVADGLASSARLTVARSYATVPTSPPDVRDDWTPSPPLSRARRTPYGGRGVSFQRR